MDTFTTLEAILLRLQKELEDGNTIDDGEMLEKTVCSALLANEDGMFSYYLTPEQYSRFQAGQHPLELTEVGRAYIRAIEHRMRSTQLMLVKTLEEL